ncbi:hypothetical protein [Ectopseudomonas mendocina]|uniref:hypothetical protein n=1 Tax=Ectopseudomonas mendocina TaxID=300 RepID=UPI00163D3D86|nr:hypothetical protein [Pseudomonas mendocina]
MLDALLRYLYAPCFGFSLIALAIVLVGDWHLGLWCLAFLLLLAIGLSALVEAQVPYQPEWNQPRRDAWRDRIHAVINETLNSLGVLSIPLLATLLPVHDLWPHAWRRRSTSACGAVGASSCRACRCSRRNERGSAYSASIGWPDSIKACGCIEGTSRRRPCTRSPSTIRRSSPSWASINWCA